jgi:recombination protein RecR
MYPKSLVTLIDSFKLLPGVGPKTAERMALHTLKLKDEDVSDFAEALVNVTKSITDCEICHHITDEKVCNVCADHTRDQSTICIVEHSKDVIALEKMNAYHGLYHVLGGSINPLEGIGPDDLNLRSLIVRLQNNDDVKELILATNPTIEGETTALYLKKLLGETDLTITRIAHGLPVGGDLEYADEITLSKALEGRREL